MKQIAGLWLLAGVVLPFATHAQTSVTLYGVISTAVRYTSNIDGEHGSLSQLVSSGIGGSRWGLKGSEDLGNAFSCWKMASAPTMARRPTTRCSAARPMWGCPAPGAA
ncbi:porin [Achromobacter kerstersii]|uniref:porin n=1 Tax=Achromobacter kerstersii TaxID=1353890 RepID=UPI0020C7150F|nr:porin [Achromobacter kerstersii]